jgi:hypothetical protein
VIERGWHLNAFTMVTYLSVKNISGYISGQFLLPGVVMSPENVLLPFFREKSQSY